MVNPQLGNKRSCTTCGARFYDLNKSPIICPKCGAEVDTNVVKIKRGGKGSRSDASKKASTVREAIADDEEDDEIDDALIDTDDESDGDDGDLMEDTSDLGEDDDDMAEVIDNMDSGEREE